MKPRNSLVYLATNDRDDVATLSRPVVLLADGATEPPTELCLLAAGVIETTKGMFRCTEESCVSVMQAHADLGRDYPFDYEHASLGAMFSPDPAESGKAAGWFKPLVRDGAIWAVDCQWTPKAREKILAREFRYLSPTFRASEDGEVRELHSCALTNDPATKKAKPIINARGTPGATSLSDKENRMKSLLVLLGLAAEASESEAVTALQALKAQIAELGRMIALTGKSNVAEAIGVIAGWKAGSEQAVALAAKLEEHAKVELARKVDELIAGAIQSGRLAPAGEPKMRELAQHGVAALEAALSVLPVVGKPGNREQPPAGGSTSPLNLTAEEMEGCKKIGLSAQAYAEHKAKSLAARTAA